MAVFGRAGQATITSGNDAIQIQGIYEFLRDASKADKRFDGEMRKAAQNVAENLNLKAKAEAATVTRSSQAIEVMKGMRARRDRVPTIKLSEKSAFVSKSNPNRKRKRKVTRGDVFFGAEFGGGKFGSSNRTVAGAKSRAGTEMPRKGGGRTTQFLRHRGKSGYFFWPAVRKNKANIADAYLDAIQKVLDGLAGKEAAKAIERETVGSGPLLSDLIKVI